MNELYLDTSAPTCVLRINSNQYQWEAGHSLAEGLLDFLLTKLAENHLEFKDLEKITFMSGPGSFTGLRIGAAIINTVAQELNIPLYDHFGVRQQIILPAYGRSANITPQKK